MTRLLLVALAVSLLLLSAACGNLVVRGAIETVSTIQGTVSIVELTESLNGTGGTVQVTLVTFLESGEPFTMGFCGNQTSLFPLTQTVPFNSHPGQPCATVIVVVIVV